MSTQPGIRPPYSIVYLSHGDTKYHEQTVFSLYSLLFWLIKDDVKDIQVYVYTDRPEFIPQHPLVTTVNVNPENLRKAKGPLNYIHRVKLVTLNNAMQELKTPIIYVDCDTQWIKSPLAAFKQLANNQEPLCFMHEYEQDLGEGYHDAYFHALRKGFKFQQELSVSEPWQMWNAGTIAVPKTDSFFPAVIEANDEMLVSIANKHWVEQLAVSLVAKSYYNIKPFDKYLKHYWRDSYAFSAITARAFKNIKQEKDLEANTRLCAELDVEQAISTFRLSPKDRFIRWRRKIQRSFQKRRMDLKAWGAK